MFVLLAGCAQAPSPPEPAKPKPVEAPATYINDPDCPGCLALTVTLRPDGSFLSRDQLGGSEFYDFGRWRYAGGELELAGGRDTRRYALAQFRKAAQLERLRGPFRMVGVLKEEAVKGQGRPLLVALDAQLEGAPEVLRFFRPATVLDAASCPG